MKKRQLLESTRAFLKNQQVSIAYDAKQAYIAMTVERLIKVHYFGWVWILMVFMV